MAVQAQAIQPMPASIVAKRRRGYFSSTPEAQMFTTGSSDCPRACTA